MIKQITIALLLLSSFAQAEQTITKDPVTGLGNWSLIDHELHLQLIQRLPDQTRAFFLARGFSPSIANEIATQCVFQTIVRHNLVEKNTKAITLPLPEWRIIHNNQQRQIKLKEQWDKQWTAEDVSMASRLAFRWATFPTEQTFEPTGDNNWGMISFGLPPGTTFTLIVKWRVGKQHRSAKVEAIQCPADIHPAT